MIFAKTALCGILLSAVLIVVAVKGYAQHAAVIRGNVSDSVQSKPVSLATAGLYRTSNLSKPVRNIFTKDNGSYQFSGIDTGNYIVIISHAGYTENRSAVLTIKNAKDTIDAGRIMLSPVSQNLKEVVVSAHKPLVEQTEDKLVYNTESDPSVEGQTAIDILRKTPFVSVDGDGNVQLNGQTSFKVLLNGRETAMFSKNLKDALQAFPANLIKRVEVITTPSSKYDAEGVGGIINIITKKKIVGYNGSLGLSQNTVYTTNGNASINLKSGPLGFGGYYGFGNNTGQNMHTIGETESFYPVAFYKRTNTGEGTNIWSFQFGNAELSYDLDTLNTISAYADLNGGNNHTLMQRKYDVIAADREDTSHSLYLNDNRYHYPSFNWGMDYNRKFKGNSEHELTLKMYLEKSKDDSHEKSDQYNDPGSPRFIMNNNLSVNRQSTFQADYIRPLKNDKKLELGAKAILRRADAGYESFFRYSPDDKFQVDNINSDNFNYRQDVYSLYFTYRFKWKNLNFRIGSREERTVVKGDFTKAGKLVTQDYFTFIPSIFISKQFNKKNTISLSYSKRLRRPYIWDLNPFVNNIDSLDISYGNPDLRAELYHNFELGLILIKGKTNINIRLSENFCNNQIASYSQFNEVTGVTSKSSYNIGGYSSTMLNGNITASITNKIRINSFMGVQYSFLKNKLNPAQKNSGIGGQANMNLTWEMTPLFTVFTNGGVYKPAVSLQGTGSIRYWYNMGASYKFFNKKLTVNCNMQNFFTKERFWQTNMQDANFKTYNRVYFPGIAMNLGVRWNFGKLTENVSRKKGVTNDDLKAGSNNNSNN